MGGTPGSAPLQYNGNGLEGHAISEWQGKPTDKDEHRLCNYYGQGQDQQLRNVVLGCKLLKAPCRVLRASLHDVYVLDALHCTWPAQLLYLAGIW